MENKDDFEYDVQGAPVVFTNMPERPDNPLNRPEIHYTKFIITSVSFVVIELITALVFRFYFSEKLAVNIGISEGLVTVIACCVVLLIYFAVCSRRAVIWLVHLYQHYASDATRLRCVFEPSCSEYMILAVKKYGTVIGVAKGVCRLLRCHPPNGGRGNPDYP